MPWKKYDLGGVEFPDPVLNTNSDGTTYCIDKALNDGTLLCVDSNNFLGNPTGDCEGGTKGLCTP